MSLEVKGRVIELMPEENGTSAAGKAWAKQDFAIEIEDDKYPKTMCFTVFGEKLLPAVKTLSPGQVVTVYFNAESRKHNNKYYTNLSAWRFDKEGITPQPTETAVAEEPKKSIEEQDDDLPF